MTELCTFIALPNGRYYCPNCDPRQQRTQKRVSKRQCGVRNGLHVAVTDSQCPLSPILSRLTPAGVDRLQRCQDAGCGMMLPVEGNMTCVGMGGGKCQWLAKWASCLNGTRPFPNGANDCPHWIDKLHPPT